MWKVTIVGYSLKKVSAYFYHCVYAMKWAESVKERFPESRIYCKYEKE